MICNKTPVKHRKLIGKQFIKPYHKPAITGVCISGVCTPSWAGLWHMQPSDGARHALFSRFSKLRFGNTQSKGFVGKLVVIFAITPTLSGTATTLGLSAIQIGQGLPSLAVSVRSGTMLSFSLSVYWVSG